MPGLKKLVSSFRLGKERHDEAPQAAPLGNAPPKKKNAKLHKRNKSAQDLNRIPRGESGEYIQGVGEADAARPRLAKRFMRSFVHSRQSSFEPDIPDEDFGGEMREIAALGQAVVGFDARRAHQASLAALQASQAREPHRAREPPQAREPPPPQQFRHDGSMISRLALNVRPSHLMASSQPHLVTAVSPTSPNGGPPAHCDYVPHADAILVRDSAVSETAATITAGWSPFVSARRSPDSWAAAREDQTQMGHDHVPTSSSTEPLSGLLHIPRRAGPYRYRKGKKPAIRDIDWAQVDGGAFEAFVGEYSDVSPVVPPESVVASPDNAGPCHIGKGKARAPDMVPIEVFEPAVQDYLAGVEQYRLLYERRENWDAARAKEWAIEEQKRAKQEKAERLRWEEEDRYHALELQDQLERELEEEEMLVAERGRSRDCAVCGDAKDPLDFPARAPTSTCDHPPQTCIDCLQSWMASEFDTKGCDGVKCVECPQLLDYMDVQRAASVETFEAYDKMSTRNALGSLDEFGWCLAPGCTSGQLNVENSNYMDCASCGYKQCLKHKVQWHMNETCEQYEYRTSGRQARDEDQATEAMLDTMSKKCPGKSCGWRIQKTDGCDHMTCRKCKYEFCWQCQASQTEIKRIGNTAHDIGCKFHTANLLDPIAWPFNVH
ncbi:hypothetical protein LTR36_000706 [Oleoguttula mirabilis]|uniref:RBR-type E3 ubiquitin transferase n=1 Tax=Oleoguttula mirabilis TaxID=1507867 RepID=A0AAV9JQP3_9PEZI|nr:hypothetical protein LTR36_000706 [Oleoguttula mirabilis]